MNENMSKADIKSKRLQLYNGIKRFFIFLICEISYFHYSIYKARLLKFKTISEFISIYPGSFGIYLRRGFYNRAFKKKCGKNLAVGFGSIFSYPTAEIGDGLIIEDNCVISRCVIGDNVTIASNVSLMSGAHHHGTSGTDIPIREQPGTPKAITIGDDVWIGTRSVIMNDVGTGCVIGAGAVVTKSIPEYSIAVGVPAKVIKKRVINK
jgi:acetyltransferase-like isoleucine patch superfamily enzyme